MTHNPQRGPDANDRTSEQFYDGESGVFRIDAQPSLVERIEALAARMRSAVALLADNRTRDGRDD